MVTWLIVPSHPYHHVSDEGFVRSAPYIRDMPNGGARVYGGGDGWRGLWDKTTNRYFIRSRKAKRNLKVAQLVCEAFHGPVPEGKPNVLHRDENPRNNRPENLYWGTQEENLNAPGFIAYCKGRTGENSPRAKWAKRK